MNDRELRHLSRAELLEQMIEQRKTIDTLNTSLQEEKERRLQAEERLRAERDRVDKLLKTLHEEAKSTDDEATPAAGESMRESLARLDSAAERAERAAAASKETAEILLTLLERKAGPRTLSEL